MRRSGFPMLAYTGIVAAGIGLALVYGGWGLVAYGAALVVCDYVAHEL